VAGTEHGVPEAFAQTIQRPLRRLGIAGGEEGGGRLQLQGFALR